MEIIILSVLSVFIWFAPNILKLFASTGDMHDTRRDERDSGRH